MVDSTGPGQQGVLGGCRPPKVFQIPKQLVVVVVGSGFTAEDSSVTKVVKRNNPDLHHLLTHQSAQA